MKKALFLLLLLPYLCVANFYEGTIKFIDGTTKAGYVGFPNIIDQNVQFKATLKEKPTKFSINEIDELNFPVKGKETVRVFATKVYESTIKGKVKGLSDKKLWLELYYDGKVKMYSGVNSVTYYGATANGSSRSFDETLYYIKLPSKDYPQLVFKHMPKGIGVFKLFKLQISNCFEQDCPTLVETLDKSIIKEAKYYLIGEYYDKNCAK